MKLSEYPRPPDDTGRGVHWSPSTSIWGKNEWAEKWLPFLLDAKIKWVKILDDGGGSALGLVKRLIDYKIMPVVRVYLNPNYPGFISGRETDLAHRLADIGVRYMEFGNEPDLALEWKDRDRPENWLEIVVNRYIDVWDKVRPFGIIPLFDAFGPGGRGNPFQLIAQKGRTDIFEAMVVAVHNYCLGRPLSYPNDGIADHGTPITEHEYLSLADGDPNRTHWVWERPIEDVNRLRAEHANPNISILTDSTGFRAFEYMDNLVREACGRSVPVMMTEGGYNVGQRAGTTFGDDARYPKPTAYWASRLTMDMFNPDNLPDYYFCSMPWFIAGYQMGVMSSSYEPQGPWFTNWYDSEFGLNGELPVVGMLKSTPPKIRADGPVPPEMENFYTGPDLTGRDFADELKYLEPQVLLEPAADTSQPYWKLISVQWKEEGNGYMFVKCLDQDGTPIEGQEFEARHENGADVAATKGHYDNYWGNLAMYGGLGTYRVSVKGGPGDALTNVGNGGESPGYRATNFWLTFQKTSDHEEGDVTLDFNAKDQDYLEHYRQTGQMKNEAEGFEQTVIPANGKKDHYKIIGIRHLLPEEANGNRIAFLAVLDANGNIDRNKQIDWGWQGMDGGQKPRPITQDKPLNERANVPLNPGQRCWFQVLGAESERVENIHTMYPTNGGNHSWYIVFYPVQGGSGPVDPPDKPDPPDPPDRPDNSEALRLLEEAQRHVNQANQLIEKAKSLL
ncbi:MAG: hypothetical protein D6768_17740 [Chloroflexi bacterium]|nr:MAG: hypothetical protein D6768_17740 [Chloroflexota bacterium]